MKNLRNDMFRLAPFALSALAFYGCKDDEKVDETKLNRDLLIGEWNLTELNGESYEPAPGDETAYSISFNFQANGDLRNCYGYESFVDPAENYTDCYIAGEWDIEKDRVTIIESNSDGSAGSLIYLDIEVLNEDRLEGDFTLDAEQAAIVYDVVFERID